MFSIINLLQSLIDKFKKNKGLWFTILTTVSVMGVLGSITLMNLMTSDVARKTYLEVHRVDTTQLYNILDTRYDSLLSIGGVIAVHPDLISNIKTKSDKAINELLDRTKKSINDRVHLDPIELSYYAKEYKSTQAQNTNYADLVINTSTSVTGIVVNDTGVRLIGITPILDGNKTIGAIEVSQPMASVKGDFDRLGKEFAFILDRSQLVFMSLETKQGMIQDVGERHKIFFHKYNPQFYTNVRKIDLDELQREKYAVDDSYYTTYAETVDIDGKPIGLFLIGEEASNANSFVNITKNLIGSVTTVALGLVISLVLFMF
ncbi:MAG: hypothetical protein JXQ67_06255 [Campylobacterales bacterium]|nr:hypothetical protein [Campylobacterales bacterium]